MSHTALTQNDIEIFVSRGRTLTDGEYGSYRADCGLKAVCEKSKFTECINHMWKLAEAQVDHQIAEMSGRQMPAPQPEPKRAPAKKKPAESSPPIQI